MGYVAIKGGAKAIEGAELAFEALRTAEGEQGTPISLNAIENQLRLLTSRSAHSRLSNGFPHLRWQV